MEIPEINATVDRSPVNKVAHSKALAKSLMLTKIAALGCILIIVLGYFVVMNTSVENIPIVSMAIEDDDNFSEDLKENMEEFAKKVEGDKDNFKDFLEEASGKDVKNLDKLLKAMKKTAKRCSISNLKRTAKLLADISEDIADVAELNNTSSDLQKAIKSLSTISTILLVFMIIGLFFTVLGALRHTRGPVVAGAILTTLFCMLFCGILLVILNLTSHIALIHLQRQYKKEFNSYCAIILNT